MAPPQAKPRRYSGVDFRSTLEADWACTLDHYGIQWEYERHLFELPSGVLYLPDFWLPALGTFIEVKGVGVPRVHKTQELAEEVRPDVIVLIGFAPARRSLTAYLWEPFLQWRDLVGYDTRFAKCAHCSAWQWLRAQQSRNCRRCGIPHGGLLARCGEMPFMRSEADRPSWMGAL